MSVKTTEDQVMSIPEFFKQKGYNRGQDVVRYLLDQYYIYGEDRSQLMTWTSALRSAVSRDALHFVEYYENPEMRKFFERRKRNPWHETDRVLDKIFTDISELSCYQLDERNEDVYEEFLQAIYESWTRAKKLDFKAKLNGGEDDEFVW